MKLESFVAGSVTLIAVRGRGAVTSRARRSAIGAARHRVTPEILIRLLIILPTSSSPAPAHLHTGW